MPAFTTRLNLYKPGGGTDGILPDEPVDIAKINGNMDALDAAVGAPQYTSTTRPSTPYDGQIIFESDTGLVRRYSQGASDWLVLPGSIGKGPTTARDAAYPTPGTAAARASRANAVTQWFNTDKGWTEQYFAKEGDAGASRFTRATEGWYPTVDSARVPLSNFTVQNTGGTVTRDGGNVLIAGACTVLYLTGCFTADFLDYEVEADLAGAAAFDLRWRQRHSVNGEVSSGYNRNALTSQAAGTTSVSVATATTEGAAGRVDTTDGNSLKLRIRQPFLATSRTSSRGESYDTANNLQITGSVQTAAIAADSLTLFSSGTTFTGRVRVYGINPF